jgi:hypothetical protein
LEQALVRHRADQDRPAVSPFFKNEKAKERNENFRKTDFFKK